MKSILDRLMSLVRDLFFLSVHLQFEFEDKIAHHTEEDKEGKGEGEVKAESLPMIPKNARNRRSKMSKTSGLSSCLTAAAEV